MPPPSNENLPDDNNNQNIDGLVITNETPPTLILPQEPKLTIQVAAQRAVAHEVAQAKAVAQAQAVAQAKAVAQQKAAQASIFKFSKLPVSRTPTKMFLR